MNLMDGILLVIRWAHALGAVAWVGGGVFYLLALRPAFRRAQPHPEARQAIGEEFRSLVRTAIIILVITGVILTASRLTAETVSLPYMMVLALKISLALYMFAVVWFHRRGGVAQPPEPSPTGFAKLRRALTGPTALLLLGALIFGLADLLGLLFENSLASGQAQAGQ